jgi:hypothetical protein
MYIVFFLLRLRKQIGLTIGLPSVVFWFHWLDRAHTAATTELRRFVCPDSGASAVIGIFYEVTYIVTSKHQFTMNGMEANVLICATSCSLGYSKAVG